MMLSHAVVLAEARSYIAALADSTSSTDASLEYDRVLLQLDWLHGGAISRITVVPSSDDRNVVHRVADAAIRTLADHAVDRLDLEICIAMLDAAWELDEPS